MEHSLAKRFSSGMGPVGTELLGLRDAVDRHVNRRHLRETTGGSRCPRSASRASGFRTGDGCGLGLYFVSVLVQGDPSRRGAPQRQRSALTHRGCPWSCSLFWSSSQPASDNSHVVAPECPVEDGSAGPRHVLRVTGTGEAVRGRGGVEVAAQGVAGVGERVNALIEAVQACS